MTVQSDSTPDNAPLENTPFVLYALQVPRGTLKVVGGDCGVPLHIYDLEPMGLELRIAPYLGQQPGDKVAVNLNGQPDIVSKLTQSDNDTVTLYLPKKLLFPDFVNRLTYTVTRGSQNMGTSEPLEVLYNAIRPGKEDTDPGVEGHSRLELLLPDAIKNGVGPDFPVTGAQVCVSYPYCRAYDVIRLNCNGHNVFHTVTTSEAPLPGSEIPVTVCFTVTRADLTSGGDSSEFVFSYSVTDQLANSPDPDSPWSASQIVDVDLAGTRLPAPILREIQNDPTDDPSIVDRDKLAGNPLLLIVVTADNRFQAGDLIEATYTATIPGQPDVVVIVTGNVETDEFGQKKPCILQVANDKVITNSAVKVAFALKRGGTVIANSKTATAQVIGSDTITLNPPVPAANPVDPLAYPQGMTIQVAFAASLPGDQARLVLVDLMPDPPTFSDLPLDVNHQATFNLDARFLGAWHGTAVQFVWALIRGGKEIARSGPLVLNVNRIVDGDGRFPTPVIAGQTGRELDVTKLVATDELSLAAWPLQASGQYVWLRYDGFNSSGAPIFFEDLKGVPNNVAQGMSRPVPMDWLKTLKDGSELKVTFKANFAGSAIEAAAVNFPVRNYTVKLAAAIPELIVNTSALSLTGLNVSLQGSGLNWGTTGRDPSGTSANRGASGGKPPYTYRSSNTQIASVDSNGVVRSEGNGSATITVSDAASQTKFFTVTTANVSFLRFNPTPSTAAQARQWIASVGGRQMLYPPAQELTAQVISTKFRPSPGQDYLAIGLEDPNFPATQQCFFIFVQGGQVVFGTANHIAPVICRKLE